MCISLCIKKTYTTGVCLFRCLLVESTTGAVAVGLGSSCCRRLSPCRRCLKPEPWLRFQSPLIEPDMRFSRIRLSDKVLRFRPRKVTAPLGQSYQPQPLVKVLVRELPRSLAGAPLVFSP